MEDRSKQAKKAAGPVEDLTSKGVSPDKAGDVKGGMLRRGNDEDDDLEDLEIQR